MTVQQPSAAASFETHVARVTRFTYDAKKNIHQVVIEIPANPAHATAMLRMQNHPIKVRFVLEDFPPDGDDEETPPLPFGEQR
jgi:hypothetical protein